MVFGLYSAPTGTGMTWSDCKIGDINDATEWSYTKYFCGTGTFTLVIPRISSFADVIEVNTIITLEGEGFIVKNILKENDTLKITGYDLNGLLLDRITLYSGESEIEGKDAVVGTTEFIAKHFVRYNLTECTDEDRIIPRLSVADNKGRGTENDTAAPRLECVADVVADILAAADMGYRISLNTSDGTATPFFIFDVLEETDRTAGQSENSRVIFSFPLGNITQMQREVGVTSDKNLFYCDLEDDVVQSYYQAATEEAAAPAGFERREEYLSLGCSVDEIEQYAEHEIADRYGATDSLTVTAGNPLDYGTVYEVGDIVTVYDRERSVQLDSVISAVEIKRTATDYTVKVTLGESKPKLLDSYVKKSEATAKTVRSGTTASGTYTTAIAFTDGGFDLTYASTSGTVVNTYTITEDSSGNITKITNETAGRGIDVTYE